ncbi:hypothetical protein NM688_g3573 [Phlebia brevispora]|uniref:Uncharacterized protein n=1 Tax=Phlebia brevispora TaxID=194682 RepID=A0ACC1T5K1_9APHY|nr:hypothetical protein NM688_g3573 [Phlebia brevispora]
MPSYIVVGASRGIGLEFIRQLSAKPENVVIGVIRNRNTSKDAVALEDGRPNLHLLLADITDYPALQKVAEDSTKLVGGKLDYLINNAAFQESQHNGLAIDEYPDEKTLEDDLLQSVKVNVMGVINTINAFLPLLKASAEKSTVKVVSLSSGMADTDLVVQHGVTMTVPYAISKAGLNMVIAKYASKYRGTNLGFLAISPGVVNTRQQVPTPQELQEYEAMASTFKEAYPHWTGPITPEVSVKMMLEVVERWDVKDSGAFVSHHGNKQWL